MPPWQAIRDMAGRCELHDKDKRCANIVICHFRKPGLSADDRRIDVLKTAFEAFSDSKMASYRFCLNA
jgi:hypothetical protein